MRLAKPPADDFRCGFRVAPALTVLEAVTDNGTTTFVAQAPSPPAPDPARERLLARLRASADPYANGVAVWLDVHDTDDAAALAQRSRRLSAMAASTHDPRLYSLVLRTCWQRTDTDCTALSARRWAELDPGNAMPWMLLWDEAVRRDDVSGAQEAMFHVTQSATLAERDLAPLQPIVEAASDDPASLVAARAIAEDAIGIVRAQIGPSYLLGCGHPTPGDANASQQCTALLDLLEHRSDTVLARSVGARADQRITGSGKAVEQLAPLFARRASLEAIPSSSCDDVRATLAFYRREAVDGEVAALQGVPR